MITPPPPVPPTPPTPTTKPAGRRQGQKRTPEQAGIQRSRIFQMVCESYTQAEIARELNLAESTVSRDVKACLLEANRNRGNTAEERLSMLVGLEYTERVAWQRFWVSIEDRETTNTEQTAYGADGTKPAKRKASVKREKRDGSAKWLEIILRCKQERSKILALYVEPEGGWPPMPNGRTVTSTDAKFNFGGMSAEELLSAAAQLELEGRDLVEEARRITAGYTGSGSQGPDPGGNL